LEHCLTSTCANISEKSSAIISTEEACRQIQNELTMLHSVRSYAGGELGRENINQAADLKTKLRIAKQGRETLQDALYIYEKLKNDLSIDIGRLQMQLDRLKNNVDNYEAYGYRR
jgi:hypothetical protein